jgi:hypothetical protein
MADDKKAAEKTAEPAEVRPYGKGSLSATVPQVSPDGHVHLSAEDIEERDADS